MIDTHVHIWKLSRNDYGWLRPDSGMLYQDFMPKDLHPELIKNGISEVVAVQAAPAVEETVFLLKLADEHAWIIAVVGWLDVGSTRFDLQYEQVRAHPRFAGIRVDASLARSLEPERRDRILGQLAQLAGEGHVVELLVRPQDMPSMLELLDGVPELRVIVNHLGLPLVEGAAIDDWQHNMRRLADRPQAMCKLSGMTGFVEIMNASVFKPHVDTLLHIFGVNRLLFGSDWPVSLRSGDYSEVINFFYEVLPEKISQSDLLKISRENALACYGISIDNY